MSVTRRGFLKYGLAGAVLANLPGKAKAQAEQQEVIRRSEPSILQGATDETKTQFSIVYDRSKKLSVVAINLKGHELTPDFVEVKTMASYEKSITKVYFSHLSIHDKYQLVLKTEDGEILDQREFKTLETNNSKLKFALCSCMDEYRHDAGIWQDLMEKSPDVIFFIGDSVYTDWHPRGGAANPEQLWIRYSEARSTLDIYFSKKLIPIFAVWDDHDFGLDNSGSDYKYVKESKQNFLSFFAQDPGYCSVLVQGPGVSSAVYLAKQLFVLMDGRSFRLARGSKERYAHWGQDQENWLYRLLDEHAGIAWLMNGIQYVPSFIFKESISRNFPINLEAFFTELRNSKSKVILVSGDVHYSEVSELEQELLGYRSYEITSSGIHSVPFPGAPGVVHNSRRLEGTGQRNYVIVEAHYKGSFLVTSHSKNKKVNFSRLLGLGRIDR